MLRKCAVGAAAGMVFLLSACGSATTEVGVGAGDATTSSAPDVSVTTSGTAPNHTRDYMIDISTAFGHLATEAEIETMKVVTIAPDSIERVGTVFPQALEGSTPEDRAQPWTLFALVAKEGAFRAPECPPSPESSGCPVQAGDTLVVVQSPTGFEWQGIETESDVELLAGQLD